MNHDETRISFDALVTMAVTEANQRELAQLPSAEQMEAEFQPSARLEKKVEQTLRRCRSAKRRRAALRWVRRTATVAAALWVVFTGALVPVQAVQQAAYSTLLRWKEEFTSVIISSDANSPHMTENIQITYLPEGYCEQNTIQKSDPYIKQYKNEKDKTLIIQIFRIEKDHQIDLDNEYSSYYTVEFDDISALWVQNEHDVNALVYEANGYLFNISSSLDLSELIHIAQGIKLE